MFKYSKEYANTCDVYKRVGKPSQRDEIPLNLVRALQPFEKYVVDFVGPLNPSASKAIYVATTIDYLTQWVESPPTQHFSTNIVARVQF